jgi:hypothetical protein
MLHLQAGMLDPIFIFLFFCRKFNSAEKREWHNSKWIIIYDAERQVCKQTCLMSIMFYTCIFQKKNIHVSLTQRQYKHTREKTNNKRMKNKINTMLYTYLYIILVLVDSVSIPSFLIIAFCDPESRLEK